MEPARGSGSLPPSASRVCTNRCSTLSPSGRFINEHLVQFGRVQDIVNDCCGYCPVPKTDEEKEIAEEEAKNYVSGKISFMKDDPGRQVSVIHIVTFSALFLKQC